MFDAPTPNLTLPYLMPAQAQKHVTHNEAIRMLDTLVQLAIVDRDLTVPPATPTEGARYLVPAAPTGAWTGQVGRIAAWQDGAWAFFVPRAGWLVWVADEARAIIFDGVAWQVATGPTALTGEAVQNLIRLGIAATADATNRLAVAAPATLFDHAGAGHQVKLNKAAVTDTASLLFQTGYAGRAEIGTCGDDHLHVKVSANGSTFTEALRIDGATGATTARAVRPAADNAHDLGASGARWAQLWAANGTIQTSDARDKVAVAPLAPATAADIVDAVDPVTYRWRRDDAASLAAATLAVGTEPAHRRHAGFLAQDVRAALAAADLNIAAWGLSDRDDAGSRQWLRPDELLPILWAALKATRAELAGLRDTDGDAGTPPAGTNIHPSDAALAVLA